MLNCLKNIVWNFYNQLEDSFFKRLSETEETDVEQLERKKEINYDRENCLTIPFCMLIAESISKWIVYGKVPYHVSKSLYGEIYNEDFSEDAYLIANQLKQLNGLNKGKCANTNCKESCDCLSMDEITAIERLLDALTKFDILKLIGVNRTVGSLEVSPPKFSVLWTSFNKVAHPKSKLTVGARALSKHCHRSKDLSWGVCTGKEEEKNKCARESLLRVLNDITWMNLHLLPHDTHVFEVRCSQGYGVRWSADGTELRGFLEPPMPDGHKKGWKH